ncbi:MAG TPA: heme o synthase [Chthoniobacterales bacterium]|nr:heme o synthase [Chthoniobacterales bacterium]
MKSIVATPGESPILEKSGLMSDLAELIKARLTMLVLLTTAVGYYLGAERGVDWLGLFHAVFGTAMAAAGAAALNQWWERPHDALMHRTRERPIPAGRMRPRNAFLVGAALAVAGVVYLAASCNWLSALLAAATIGIYILAYTPLKRISTVNTLVGAVPGALPPMIGWAAATGNAEGAAWSLFAILFCWQMPHFFAIAWMYREDYARGGFRMLSHDDETGVRSASQGVLFCMLLLIITGMPTYLGLTTEIYLPIALALGGWFIYMAMQFHRKKTFQAARALFLASIIYLPLLLLALVLTKS